MKRVSKERLAKLVGIRDRSLAVLANNGEWERVSSINALFAQIGTLKIMHHSVFQKVPVESEQNRYLRSQLKSQPNLPYGLNIWHQNKKVLNLEWDGQGEFNIIGYKSGESEMLLSTIPVGCP